MSFLSVFRGLAAKVALVPIITFLVGLAIPAVMGYQLLQRGAERETHEKAVDILDLLSAVQYCTEAESGARGSEHASPFHTGPSVAQRVVQRYESSNHGDSIRYRQVTLFPTDPKNQADEYESGLIHWFADNPKTMQADHEIQVNGKGYHVLSAPITVTQDRCLTCHGTPSAAPAWRVKAYGRIGGFGWKKGQVVGLNAVYIPSDYPRGQAAMAFWAVGKSIGALGLMCCVMLLVRAHVLIIRPVRRMLAVSEAIPKGEWGTWADARFPDELATLGRSFHYTTDWLRHRVVREEMLRALFQQFIPASVAAKALGKDANEILVGTRHSVTVMIINIRNFKLLMDHLPPDQTVTTLNEYFSEVNEIITANKGLVSKYMGDSVMALFGMPLGHENHALNAVRSALTIPAALQDLCVRLDEQYGWQLGVGIGISTGEPIVGSFGSSAHREYTVLGDVVGEAHQLEAATKSIPEEDSILISEATYRHVMSEVHVLDLGEKAGVSGNTVHAYAVQGFRNEVRLSRAA